MPHVWYQNILFGFLLGVGIKVADWLLGKFLK